MRKAATIILVICMLVIPILQGCGILEKDDKENNSNISYDEQMNIAKTTPFGKYPELITYTLGKMTGNNNSNMPEGDTYEDNAYTRYLKNTLNIQNEDVFENLDEQYNTSVTMAIASKKLPDIMVVSSLEDLNILVQSGMIEDLTDSYDKCASDKIKEIYSSYGDDILDMVTYDGKLMAIPETNIAEGPNLIWLRKDWMDKLNLDTPKTLDDVENIVSQFISHNMSGSDDGTIGIACDTNITGESGYSSEYCTDIIFANFGAFPKQWIKNADGEIVYGSVEPEAKNALSHLNKLYTEGILDSNFLLRTNNNIIELIENGECGSFFGPWWAPNNPLMSAIEKNPEADWVPYLISTDESGVTEYATQDPSYKFIVVRKGYEYPEIVMKQVSVMFDKIRYEDSETDEFKNYFQMNVDPTARPLAINVDYNNALSICYNEINEVLTGKRDANSLKLLERSYYESCKAYLDDKDSASTDEWAAYSSRIVACSLFADNTSVNAVKSYFFGTTKTMETDWWKLKNKENQAFLKIITGEEPIDYFDTFVREWNEQGGLKITQEVREVCK